MPGARGWSRWRFLISPKWLAWHAFMVASVTGMLLLGGWQLRRAEAGNALSWAYTFEWPFFAVLGVVFWAKTIRDEVHPPAGQDVAVAEAPLPAGVRPAAGRDGTPGAGQEQQPATPEDEELAAYNAYLARLHREVEGHGKWHGLR